MLSNSILNKDYTWGKKMKILIKKTLTISFTILMIAVSSINIVEASASVNRIYKGKLITVSSEKKGQMTVKWKKLKGVSGYRIKLSTKKNFSTGTKIFIVKSKKITSIKIKKLKLGKTYYVKVRGYKKYKVNGKYKKVYGKYSNVKKVKIKKSNTVKYSPQKIRLLLNNANTLIQTMSLLDNDDGSGYTKYSYLDWSNFALKLSKYKTKLKEEEHIYKIINTKKFKKAYNDNKKYTYKNINKKKVTDSARNIYTNLSNSVSNIKSGLSSSLNTLQSKSLSEIWKHYKNIRMSLDNFANQNFNAGMTEYEKVTIIYNYLCDRIYYEKTNSEKYGYDVWKADSTLNRVLSAEDDNTAAGVCGTYACAFQMMCQYYGIKSQVLCSDNHTWNTVEIDGVWYTCDLTIGDECGYGDDDITQNISKYFYKYFYTEKEMSTAFKKEHKVVSILPEFYYFFVKPSKNFSLVVGGDKLNYRFING